MSKRRIPTEDREPDPARSYERAKPEKEAGMGRLDTVRATPTKRPDKIDEAVENVHAPHQLNADEDKNERQAVDLTKKATAAAAPVDRGVRRRPRRAGARSPKKK